MLAIGQGSKKSIEDQVSSMGSTWFLFSGEPAAGRESTMGNTNTESLKISDIDCNSTECAEINNISPEVRGIRSGSIQ